MYNGKHGGDGEAIVLSFPVILRRQGREGRGEMCHMYKCKMLGQQGPIRKPLGGTLAQFSKS